MSRLPVQEIQSRYQELNQVIAKTTDTQELIKLSKELKKLQIQNNLAQIILDAQTIISENEEMLKELEPNNELYELTKSEIEEKQEALMAAEEELLSYLAPSHPNDDKNVILEIRAGAGGDESSLFAADLLKMYTILASNLGAKLQIVSTSPNDFGGYKEVIAEIRGDDIHSWFKYEGGVHRVQRVPSTEKQGRIHTSTVSVAVMPLIEGDNDFKLDLKEVEVIASTSQGAGGQSVNTTYSAIKVKHLPTGIEAQSQDERNQQQNRIKALQVLTSRVYDHFEQERLAKETAERREQVGNADRSEKIRTYNYPQDRVTDHRYSQSWNNLEGILSGDILKVIQKLKQIDAEETIKNLN